MVAGLVLHPAAFLAAALAVAGLIAALVLRALALATAASLGRFRHFAGVLATPRVHLAHNKSPDWITRAAHGQAWFLDEKGPNRHRNNDQEQDHEDLVRHQLFKVHDGIPLRFVTHDAHGQA